MQLSPDLEHQRIGRLLADLLERFSLVLIAPEEESESHEAFGVRITTVARDARATRATHSADTLLEALEVVLELVPRKQCTGPCARTLPLSEFPKKPSASDGRAAQCHVCSRERYRRYSTRAGKEQRRRQRAEREKEKEKE